MNAGDSENPEPLRARLMAAGFDDVRFARVEPAFGARFRAWLAEGQHADMTWLERSTEKRADPGLVLPGARSVVMLGVNYGPGGSRRGDRPAWARYALYSDYHDTIKTALVEAGRILEEMYGVSSGDYRYYVDTGPVLERGWAARAGLGFIGKNAMLISRRHGNWLFLAALLTRLDFAPDEPVRRQPGGENPGALCGKCTRCLDACPTQAFSAPGVVDARRCISYQTIENRGIIPRELRAGIGDRIYGCDTCLEVCPWNRFAQEGRRLLLHARPEIAALPLREILELTPERFTEIFRKTAIKRLKLVGLLRNACVVAGNTGARDCLPVLMALAGGHASSTVRAHAVWAVRRLGGESGLAEGREREMDPTVRAEYEAVMTDR